ncbi:hypothetical protein TRVL_10216 [Trypanosoma vivax]|nr:hypothetical protein TRVL_10216 [Trypanosoma vivax]
MRVRRMKHTAPHRGEAPQGLVVEAAPWPSQRQSSLFPLDGRSGNPSASQSAAAIKKRPRHPTFAHGPCGRTRQFDHSRRTLFMRAVNFAELFKTPALVGSRFTPAASELSGPNRVRSPPRPRAPARPVLSNTPSRRRAARLFPKPMRQVRQTVPHPPFLQ